MQRRKTIVDGGAMRRLWMELDAMAFCTRLSEKGRQYVINSHVDYGTIAQRTDDILGYLLEYLQPRFPDSFLTSHIQIRFQDSRHVSRGRSRSESRPGLWVCMDYRRTMQQWQHQPIEKTSPKMKALIAAVSRCMERSAEKFLVVPFAWRLETNHRMFLSHYSCLVIDVAPKRQGNRRMRVTILDVNGYGSDPHAYKNVFDYPPQGLNPMIKTLMESVFEHVSAEVGFEDAPDVRFPAFRRLNVSADAAREARKRDMKLFPDVQLTNNDMEKGVCALATMFIIVRLACDQRRVFRRGIDETMRDFIRESDASPLAEYRHVMFARAFAQGLMSFLGLDDRAHGLRGEAYVVRDNGRGSMSIRKQAPG